MPRVADSRSAAAPTTQPQRARRVRILQAATEQAMAKDFDRVQMHDVAEAAEVAIGTLYRYFPSKTHLFVGVMARQVQGLSEGFARNPPTGGTPASRIFDTLWGIHGYLLDNPTLASAMIQAVQSANAETVPEVRVIDTSIREALARVLGTDDPDQDTAAVIRILIMMWFGILQSSLNARFTTAEAEYDLRLACHRLLDGRAVGTSGAPGAEDQP
ncbi:TetR family transcriptional regulator [Rhodococcus sp. X156]|uniref:TetR family transcriptional regulator n=1 Tax=Rhodococcus sp. X156 TaxID=2499145 RepID=UPI000FD7973A|nr:TetR family transcriptional regulator [Rhodococcus sp. X156]